VIKSYCTEVPFNGMTSVPNLMKIYHAVQKLLVGDPQTQTHTHTQTDRQAGGLISLLSRLKRPCRSSQEQSVTDNHHNHLTATLPKLKESTPDTHINAAVLTHNAVLVGDVRGLTNGQCNVIVQSTKGLHKETGKSHT
jgi:hypothetical protein